jgi:putative addiction module component (TIGR02574 family)
MTADTIEAAFKALPIDEQREILSKLTEHFESLPPTDITPDQAAILDRRVKSIREHPERLVPWEDVNARALETIKNARK